MGRTTCTEPQCLYSRAIPPLPLWAVRPVQSLSACTVELYLYSPYGPYDLYRAAVLVQGCTLPYHVLNGRSKATIVTYLQQCNNNKFKLRKFLRAGAFKSWCLTRLSTDWVTPYLTATFVNRRTAVWHLTLASLRGTRPHHLQEYIQALCLSVCLSETSISTHFTAHCYNL
jgi:hypothetical protein